MLYGTPRVSARHPIAAFPALHARGSNRCRADLWRDRNHHRPNGVFGQPTGDPFADAPLENLVTDLLGKRLDHAQRGTFDQHALPYHSRTPIEKCSRIGARRGSNLLVNLIGRGSVFSVNQRSPLLCGRRRSEQLDLICQREVH